jgi:hypothetical protein
VPSPQEPLLSPTIQVIGNVDLLHEKMAPEPDGDFRGHEDEGYSSHGWPSYSLKVKPWPDLNQYFSLVHGYNARDLSFESDALNAFMAIISAISKSFSGGFHFGLPVFPFNLEMLWSSITPLKRHNIFPSWSWLGWSWSGEVFLSPSYTSAWRPDVDTLHPTLKTYSLSSIGMQYVKIARVV